MSINTDTRVIARTLEALKRGIKYILHQGGTSSGKTFGILYSLLFFAIENFGKGNVISVVAQTLPHLKKGALNDFRRILAMTNLDGVVVENKSDHVFILPNGCRFEFYAPDDEEKAKSGKRDILFINEANGVLYSIAKQLMIRTTGAIILDWNPSGKFWLHQKLLKALKTFEYIFTRTTYRDNKSLDPSVINEIERLRIINPTDYDIYGMGVEGQGSEIIYPGYELVDEFPDTDNVSCGLDFGFTNHPSASARCALYDGALWFDEIFYEKGLSNKKIFEQYDVQSRPYGYVIADSAEPKSIDELLNMGLKIKGAVKGPDSIKYGIDKIKEYPIKVTSTSDNLIDEINAYRWIMVDGQPTNKPADKNNHLMDAIRYGVQGILGDHTPIIARVQQGKKMGFTNF